MIQGKMTKEEEVTKFATSMRGGYIVAQALHYGIEALSKVEGASKEINDIKDMEYLRDNIYNFPIVPEVEITSIKSNVVPEAFPE